MDAAATGAGAATAEPGRPRRRRRCGLVLALALPALAGAAESAGAAGLGRPPVACEGFQHLTDRNCLLDSRYLDLTLSPHVVGVGDVITATGRVRIGTPNPYGFSVSFRWTLGLGTQVGACPPVRTQASLVVTCRYRATAPTRGFRTVEQPFGSSQGPAFSRDFHAVVGEDQAVVEGTIRRSPPPAAPAPPGVAGVRVTIHGPGAPVHATTNSEGYYHALLPRAGRYTVTPAGRGLQIRPARRVVSVRGSTARADFTARVPAYTVTGTLRSVSCVEVPPACTHEPLPGARVRATGPAGAVIEATSGRDGRYRLEDLEPGRWTVAPVDAGFRPQRTTLTLTADRRGVDFEACTKRDMGGGEGPRCSTEYRVELFAWIPHRFVVDPDARFLEEVAVDPDRFTSDARRFWPLCLTLAQQRRLVPGGGRPRAGALLFNSVFKGDGHAGPAGSHRALVGLRFVWDGSSIRDPRQYGRFGDTERVIRFARSRGGPVVARCAYSARATRTIEATKGRDANLRDVARLRIDAANPLTPPRASPAINAELTATPFYSFDRGSVIRIQALTDRFPSYGVRVYRAGRLVFQRVLLDASGVRVFGAAGAVNLARGLTSHTNAVTVDTPVLGAPREP